MIIGGLASWLYQEESPLQAGAGFESAIADPRGAAYGFIIALGRGVGIGGSCIPMDGRLERA